MHRCRSSQASSLTPAITLAVIVAERDGRPRTGGRPARSTDRPAVPGARFSTALGGRGITRSRCCGQPFRVAAEVCQDGPMFVPARPLRVAVATAFALLAVAGCTDDKQDAGRIDLTTM